MTGSVLDIGTSGHASMLASANQKLTAVNLPTRTVLSFYENIRLEIRCKSQKLASTASSHHTLFPRLHLALETGKQFKLYF